MGHGLVVEVRLAVEIRQGTPYSTEDSLASTGVPLVVSAVEVGIIFSFHHLDDHVPCTASSCDGAHRGFQSCVGVFLQFLQFCKPTHGLASSPWLERGQWGQVAAYAMPDDPPHEFVSPRVVNHACRCRSPHGDADEARDHIEVIHDEGLRSIERIHPDGDVSRGDGGIPLRKLFVVEQVELGGVDLLAWRELAFFADDDDSGKCLQESVFNQPLRLHVSYRDWIGEGALV
mmetsp:Transcript_6374/g.11976  ORF Transcript_6374/g.11976 Transcript_6374/m.11976 type:complete len:231 (-) Transcript_6374:162-854(-)